MNLLFAVDSLTLGGAQTFLLRLVRALARDHKIIIYVLTNAERDRQLEQSFLEGLNIRIVRAPSSKIAKTQSWLIGKVGNVLYRLGYRTFRKDFTNGLKNRKLRHIIESEKIDCINSHLFSSDWRVFQAVVEMDINWVVSLHGCYETYLHGGYDEKFNPNFIDVNFIEQATKVYGRANALVLASDKNREIEQYLPAAVLGRTKRKKIYYGYEPSEFIPKRRSDYDIPGNSLIFGMMARGIEEKGWAYLLEAFAKLTKEGHNIYLILVCDLTKHIETLATQYRQTNIRFMGPSYSPLEWVSMFDIAVLPTYFSGESLPNTVIEYLYCGKPVIATDTGDISNMLSYQNEKAGVTIPLTSGYRPDLEALIAAMRMYLTEPQLIYKQGILAKRAFQKFDMDTCVRSYLNLFKK